MKVGVLEILALPARHLTDATYHFVLTKQYASITPQAVSVWCRQLGHETVYATYYGIGDPRRLLPQDLDVVFIACYTQASAMAYAMAKIFQRMGTRTVIGGPHAKAFPVDCLRFFDLVVKECDKDLIKDILGGSFMPGSIISSDKPYEHVPSVEERMPEIRASAFLFGKHCLPSTTVPILASTGCPYRCDFCIDWNTSYRQLSGDRLSEDLRYLAKEMPNAMMAFHDPNFAVKFDQVLDVLEGIPPEDRTPYIMESSLSNLRGSRVERLKETNCIAAAPGVESWTDYSNKAGSGRKEGLDKIDQVVDHFQNLHENVPYLQANFLLGLDTDEGDMPIALTEEFMERTPYVWPVVNIPVPFGGTPLYDKMLNENRILQALPFSFYYAPYLSLTLKNYDPVEYYESMIKLFRIASSRSMMKRRMKSATSGRIKLFHWTRTISTRADIRGYHRILKMLRTDAQFLAFHEGRTKILPEFYHKQYEKMLGPFASLLSRADRTPILEQETAPEPVHLKLESVK